jgi:carboxyl-terminal processing protease
MSGIHLFRSGDSIKIASADQDSPASEAGVMSGDEVAQVGGKSTRGMRPDDIRDLLRARNGQRIRMVLNRDGRERIVDFLLRKRI